MVKLNMEEKLGAATVSELFRGELLIKHLFIASMSTNRLIFSRRKRFSQKFSVNGLQVLSGSEKNILQSFTPPWFAFEFLTGTPSADTSSSTSLGRSGAGLEQADSYHVFGKIFG